MADKCSVCDEVCGAEAKYCGKCGSKIHKPTQTLNSFLKGKKTERQSLFGKSGRKENNKKFQKNNKKVTINVGIMQLDGASKLKKLRGNWASISVAPEASWEEVLRLAVEKHATLNQYFCGYEDHVLLYPDQKLCRLMPERNETFTVEKYKQFLNQPYSRINLFVCISTQYLLSKPDDDSSPDDADNKKGNSSASVSSSLPSSNNNNRECLHDSMCDPFATVHTTSSSISPPTISTLDLFQQDKASESASSPQIICPICQKLCSASTIEVHADECAESNRRDSIFHAEIHQIDDDDDDDDDEADHGCGDNNNATQYFNQETSTEERVCDLIEINTEVAKCATDINGPHVMIIVFRGRCFSDFNKFFSKPWNQSKLCYRYIFKFAGEDGIDEGGISREFFTEALREVKEKYFTGTDEAAMEPMLSLHAVADGTIKQIGQLLAASICNFGPAPNFLKLWIYNYFVGGIDMVLKDLPSEISDNRDDQSHIVEVYNEVYKAQTDEVFQKVLTSESGYKVLHATGYRGLPTKVTIHSKNEILKSILLKKVEAYTTILEQLMAGMEKFRLLSFIREKPDVFRMIFCKSTLFSWTYDSLVDSLKVVWSDDGSNKKASELETYRMFIDMCDNSYHQGAPFRLPELMQFITGSETISPCGGPKLTLQFKFDCAKTSSGKQCRCLPTANTCATSLTIPIHASSSLETMTEQFSLAIKNTRKYGFGMA